jgi:hypothetical protein
VRKQKRETRRISPLLLDTRVRASRGQTQEEVLQVVAKPKKDLSRIRCYICGESGHYPHAKKGKEAKGRKQQVAAPTEKEDGEEEAELLGTSQCLLGCTTV